LTKTIILSIITNALDKKEWKDFHYVRVVNTRKELKSKLYTVLDLKKYRKSYKKFDEYAQKYLIDMNYNIFKYMTEGEGEKKSLLDYVIVE
jgi:hypothetical protein